MEQHVSATELARKLGDVLARVRYRGDTFIVERNGHPVARLTPIPGQSAATLGEVFAAWRAAGNPDPQFAEDLERIDKADRLPEDAWRDQD